MSVAIPAAAAAATPNLWILNTLAGSPGRYWLLDEQGSELPHDADTRAHQPAFVIDRKAQLMLDVRGAHEGSYESCRTFACESTALGRVWRPIRRAEAAYYVAETSMYHPACDPVLYSKIANRWIWCGDEFAGDDTSAPDYAWGVPLRGGGAYLHSRSRDGLALPVSELVLPPGQSI